jgi:hypothetical protein
LIEQNKRLQHKIDRLNHKLEMLSYDWTIFLNLSIAD